ncbi:hypothetical protein M0R45_003121 [Rubus argutus]|uniref:Chloride channel protein n=1 Tax=Rubus argutus TaxID=59490 RepID=A0AAW1YE76_RUBAR
MSGNGNLNAEDPESITVPLISGNNRCAFNNSSQDWRSRGSVHVFQYIFMKWFSCFLVGIIVGLIGFFNNLAVENIAGVKFVITSNMMLQQRYWLAFAVFFSYNLALTLFASTITALVAPAAAGSGIPEVKAYLNGVDAPGIFSLRTLIVKIVGSISAVSSSSNWKGRAHDRRDLITCGSAAGIAVSFRSPVGGLLFALEEMASWWRGALLWRAFFTTAVIAIVLRALIDFCLSGKCGLFGTGGLIMFDVYSSNMSYHLEDVPPVLVLAFVGGILGSIYNFILTKVLRIYNLINEKGIIYKVLLACSISIFTSFLLFGLPWLASCRPCPSDASEACPTLEGRYGVVVPAGLFVPVIVTGATYGRFVGMLVGSHTNLHHGLYAVLGAASLLGGTMRMTVSLCVIILELTNNLLLLPLIMLVLLVSKTTADTFNSNIYDLIMKAKGFPYLEAHAEPYMRQLTVSDVVTGPLQLFNGIEKVGNIVHVLRSTGHNGFPFSSEDFAKRGSGNGDKIEDIELTEEEMEMYIDLHPFTNASPYTVVETMSLAKALILFRQVGLRHLLVIPTMSSRSPVVGILTRHDFIPEHIFSLHPMLVSSRWKRLRFRLPPSSK